MRALILLVALAGCVGPDLDLMTGQGMAHVTPDGVRSYRYVLANSAHAGIASGAELDQLHRQLIGQWAATHCPRGYGIADRQVVGDHVIYSGPCR